MPTFHVTTATQAARDVRAEILRVDPAALIACPKGHPNYMAVRTRRMSAFTLEAIDGVAQVFLHPAADIGPRL